MARKKKKKQEEVQEDPKRGIIIWVDENDATRWDVQGDWIVLDIVKTLQAVTEEVRLRGLDISIDRKLEAMLATEDE